MRKGLPEEKRKEQVGPVTEYTQTDKKGQTSFPLSASVALLECCLLHRSSGESLRDSACVRAAHGLGVLPNNAFAYKQAAQIHRGERGRNA